MVPINPFTMPIPSYSNSYQQSIAPLLGLLSRAHTSLRRNPAEHNLAQYCAHSANQDKQNEKIQIRQQIEATRYGINPSWLLHFTLTLISSTAKLAPKLNETELIQSLVLQFLTHDGYIETARAFADETHSEKQALNLDPNTIINGFDVKEDEDAGHRQRKS